MLKDYAQGNVLPEFTDEMLQSDDSGYSPELRKLLLRAPAEQRQNVTAEAHRRGYNAVGGSEKIHVPKQPYRTEIERLEEILQENGW